MKNRSAQPHLLQIHSDKQLIDVTFDNKPIDGRWLLQPERKPDVLTIDRYLQPKVYRP